MEQIVDDVDASGFSFDENIGRVSLVGAGMKTHPGVAASMFEVLAKEDVNIEMISTSSIRISCVVQEGDVERAVRALHDAFELGEE
jgi:aspartate kinase